MPCRIFFVAYASSLAQRPVNGCRRLRFCVFPTSAGHSPVYQFLSNCSSFTGRLLLIFINEIFFVQLFCPMVESEDEGEINDLCRHEYRECSDLPSLAPIFSCAPCDEWRTRMHSVQSRRRILHLENRVGEKIINMVLRFGFQKRQQSATSFISKIQELFQKEVLGSGNCPSQWKLRYTKDTDGSVQLEPIQERNSVIRAMLHNINMIIDGSIPDNEGEFKEKLLMACSKYNEAISILTSHRALTDEEIDTFQDLIDDFFETWVELFGHDGLTNYLHLLGSGHVMYFLQKYRCLYIYSQQGWEALNSVCTSYILQNSSRGGRNSGQNKTQSYIYPLIRYLMRDLLWKTRLADKFFLERDS